MPSEIESLRAECRVCRATDAVLRPRETAMVRSAFGCAVWQCRRCRLMFAWPPPAAVEDTYEGEYFRGYDEAGCAMPAAADEARYERRLRSVPLALGRLLDVGVGGGDFLVLARRLGWQVTGLDVSRWAAERVQRQFDIDVKVGPLLPGTFPAGRFDVVHLSHVLEHMPDPVEALQTIRTVLSAEGRVIIEVPNELDNLYTWARLRTGTARPYAVPSPHLWFFTPESLRRAVQAGGFAVEHLATLRDAQDASVVRRAAKRLVGSVERLMSRGSLIEVIATPERTGGPPA